MQSKTSMSFKAPVLGFAKAQLHSFMFSALIFTIVMVAISFMTGANPLYGYNVSDISYRDSRSFNFALTIAAAAFVFAAFTFKPFMAKNEADTFLSLPIKKTEMLSLQIIFGLACILFSSLLSFGVIYPAMNLTKFVDFSVYWASVRSIFTEIILPMCSYYLLSVILILKTRNFWSALVLFAAFCCVCFNVGSYINSNVGMDAIGVDLFEITGESQTFYHNSAILMPTRFIAALLKTYLPLGASVIAATTLNNIINILLIAVLFVLFILAGRRVVAGELNRPFDFMPLLKTLPFAAIIGVLPLLFQSLSALWLFVAALVLTAAAAALIILFIKPLKRRCLNITAVALVLLLPLSSMLLNRPYSHKITYELPRAADIECVYFNPVYPTTHTDIVDDVSSGKLVPAMRYRFESEQAIALILETNSEIIAGIRDNELMSIENMPTTEGLIINPADPLEFYDDDYAAYRQELSELEELQKQNTLWGMFDTEDVMNDYWAELYDYNSTIEATANRTLPISGNDVVDYMADEMPKYTATFYYKLKDGRWMYRVYAPIPISWIDEQLLAVLDSDEYKERLVTEQ